MSDSTKRRKELLLEVDALASQISDRRKDRIDSVLSHRISSVSVVLENLNKVHNLSAVLRTAEALGIQDIHIAGLPEDGGAIARGVSQGADKWLSIHKWDDIESVVYNLKREGFVIAASVLADDSVSLDEIDFSQPVALMFGNELKGLSKKAIQLADIKFTIPMFGFVQSYNISVACAITLWDAVHKRRKIIKKNGDLDEMRLIELKASWYKKSVKFADEILSRILENDDTLISIEFENDA